MKTLPTRLVVLVIILSISPLSLFSQEEITIGTGTDINGFNEFPAPYGNALNGGRHQMLILGSELQAEGMSVGDILSVAFDVATASFINYEGFTVSIGTTTETEMTAAWIPGLTTVWGPTTYTDQVGWNTHTFDAPFFWDGSSNIVVQTCFYNQESNFNAQFNQSITPFFSTTSRSTPNPNVCTSLTGTLIPHQLRPNMRFLWQSLEVPPVGSFTQSTTNSCNGTVQFTDLSTPTPTAWEWTFGDGGTSTEQNPEYTYLSDGTWVPQLIVTNAFGADTVVGSAITVSTAGPQPVDACDPLSSGTIDGFGIVSIELGALVVNSPDQPAEGYADRSCQSESVLAGTLLHVAMTTGTVATHNMRVWIDWDNNGEFINTELVLTANSGFSATGEVPVPALSVLNTPLRVRYMADYDFSPTPDPCVGPQFGQAEDYALIVLPNSEPPTAGFSATPLFSCDGAIQFTDASLNAPTSWTWDFGDLGSSNEQSPQHTYTSSGTYTVQLTVSNLNGEDILISTDLITVDLGASLVPAACTPATQSYCCGFGITSVSFAGIINTSVDGAEGYVDRSCGNIANVTEGQSYSISISTGGTLNHDVRMWMDLNNDGDFTTNELVWSALDQQDPSGNFVMPAGDVYGTALRLRLMADVVGETTGACEQPFYGQFEDYSVIVAPNPNPPNAAFTATPTTSCSGFVQFTDASANAPQTWAWNFGDGGTSTEQSPLYHYLDPGTYDVTLTVTNDNGSDVQTNVNYITVPEPWVCDTLEVPNFDDVTYTDCQGILSDNGGPYAPYQTGTSAAVTIAPTGAEVVILDFSQFQWGNNDNRWLEIYDGPNIFSPQLGPFTGNGLGQLPNGGLITSSGSSITLRQESNGGGPPPNSAGFLLTWECSFTGVPDLDASPIGNIWPQPASEDLNISFVRPLETGTHIVLRNALGAIVLDELPGRSAKSHNLATGTLSAGAYILSVESATGRWNRSIILN